MTTLFISDLHLDASRPAATQAFLRFLKQVAVGAEALYVLGDLFESCTGNDPLTALEQQVADALGALRETGTQCFFMYGNRDFLVPAGFIDRSGLVVLPDPTLIWLHGESVLLSHGDIYCTDDTAYQRYRRVVRHPLVRRVYDALPFVVRNRIVNGLRNNSTTANAHKSYEVMDVNGEAITTAIAQFHPGTLLHGHTHRPAIHELSVNGWEARRIVLGDWYEHGSVLAWDGNGPRLTQLDFAA